MTAPGLVCGGCGTPGRKPTIVSVPQDPRPVLRFVFGWGDPPRTVMLCDACRARLERRERGRAKP